MQYAQCFLYLISFHPPQPHGEGTTLFYPFAEGTWRGESCAQSPSEQVEDLEFSLSHPPFPEPGLLITHYTTLTTPNMGFLLCPNTQRPLGRPPIFTVCVGLAASTGCVGLGKKDPCHLPQCGLACRKH